MDRTPQQDSEALHPLALELATGPNYAVFTSLLAGGHPQSQPTWVDTDGEHLIINTVPTHQKARNVQRDPRVTVLIVDRANPYRYLEARGLVVDTVGGSAAREHLDRLANRYTGGTDGYRGPGGTDRLMALIRPFRQVVSDPTVTRGGR